MPRKDPETWVQLLKQKGPRESTAAIHQAIMAEAFLLAAVDVIGLDWCIHRLHQVKRAKGDIKSISEIVLDAVSPQDNGSK